MRPREVTPAQVREIRCLRARGWLMKDIAERYGVDRKTVWNICHCKSWYAEIKPPRVTRAEVMKGEAEVWL